LVFAAFRKIWRTRLERQYQPDTIIEKTLSYDESGTLETSVSVQTATGNTDDTGVNDSVTTTFTHNSKGQLVREHYVHTFPGSSPQIYLYRYDDNGNMIERIKQGEFDYSYTTYAYEANQEPVFNFRLRILTFFPG